MPKRKRDMIKRRMAQAIYGVDRSLMFLKELHEMFSGVHDDYAQYLELICVSLINTQEMMKDFWVKAWGTFPEDIDSYRT